PLLAEQDENALGRGCEGGKSELAGIGHGIFLSALERVGAVMARRPRSCKARYHMASRASAPGVAARLLRPSNATSGLTFCCACSTALPCRSHFVGRSRAYYRGERSA